MTFVVSKPPAPMLAKAGKLDELHCAIANGYAIEPKIDGIRCLAVVDNSVQLYNRQLRNITAAFPDVVQLIRAHVHSDVLLGRLVLDGEIYVTDEQGRANFQRVQHRANRLLDVDAAAADYPAKYVAFDVLSSGRVDYMGLSLGERNAILREVCRPLVVPDFTQDEANDLAARLDGEGVMLKHLASKYEPGARSPAWRKIKWLREVECVVGGVTWGLGRREDYFAGLLCGVFRPEDRQGVGRLTYVGTVGTGFTDEMLDVLMRELRRIRTTTSPFDAAASEAGWDVQFYTAPVLRIKVRFQEYTRGGILRFPRFVGLVER